jgi:hypothetical protein
MGPVKPLIHRVIGRRCEDARFPVLLFGCELGADRAQQLFHEPASVGTDFVPLYS